jgi:hypothetical protein
VDGLLIWNGDLIVTGNFTAPYPAIARYDGVTWSGLGAGLGPAPGPFGFGYAQGRTLASFNGELIVAGHFGPAVGFPAINVARWTGNCWQPVGTGLMGTSSATWVNALTVHDGALLAGGRFSSAGNVSLTGFARWAEPNPVLSLSQPGGPGTGLIVSNARLIIGHEYYNVASFDLCPGCIGSGPYGGLCINDFGFVNFELAFPVGSYPFHFISTATSVSTGPYVGPVGMTFEALCADVTGGTVGCLSRVVRYTVP